MEEPPTGAAPRQRGRTLLLLRPGPTPTPTTTPTPAPPLPAATLERLEEEGEAKRLLRRAIAVALLFHVALLFVRLPRSDAGVEVSPPAREVFVLRATRYRPPPDRPLEIPPRRVRRVPIPDPTPDDPEPLRHSEPEEIEVAMPGDVVLAVPEDAPEAAPPPDPAPLRWRPGIVRPVKVEGPEPQYTEVARRAGVEGIVILEAVIGADGSVRDVRVLKSLPFGLSEEAVRAVEQWRYEPAKLDGRPVAVLLSLTVRFGLS